MLIIPAIDIKGGRVVRLKQGDFTQETVYADNPSEVAKRWEAQGAELLHIVDLDGASSGELKNLEAIKEVVKEVSIPIQLGGGIRSLDAVRKLMKLGVDRVIIGTRSGQSKEFIKSAMKDFGEGILVAIDCKGGKVAIEGWREVMERDPFQFAKEVEEIGISRVVFTSVERDGTLSGPDFEGVERILKETNLKVIASGGVSSLEEIRRLVGLGVEGVIIGRALYTKKINLRHAIEIAKG